MKKMNVGVALQGDPQKGITLIALIITAIVMLILVGVTINVALNGGLIEKARTASVQTQKEVDKEMLLSAVVTAINSQNGLVDFEILDENLPDGFTGEEGEYTSAKGNKFTVDENGKIEESTGEEQEETVEWAYAELYDDYEDKTYKYLFHIGETQNFKLKSTNVYVETGKIGYDEELEVPTITGNGEYTYINMEDCDEIYFHLSKAKNIDLNGTNIGLNNIINKISFYKTNIVTLKGLQGVTTIPEQFCFGCTNLSNVELPEGVAILGGGCFKYCSNLTNLKLPKSLTEIKREAFYGCIALTEITIPDGVEKIRDYTFQNCTGLISVDLSNVTSFDRGVFQQCTSLKNIVIPNGVTSINQSMFNGCSSLERIIIPSSVTNVVTDSFHECSKLNDITIKKAEGSLDLSNSGLTAEQKASIKWEPEE